MTVALRLAVKRFLLFVTVVAVSTFFQPSFISFANAVDSNCVNQKGIKIRLRRKDGQVKKMEFCDWVAEKPGNRCSKDFVRKYVRKKKTTENGDIKKVWTKRKLNPSKKCSCVCTSTIDGCPLPENINYEDGGSGECSMSPDQSCHYEYIYTQGCETNNIACEPIYSCICLDSKWSCADAQFEHWRTPDPRDPQQCVAPPADFVGDSCDPDAVLPRPPDPTASQRSSGKIECQRSLQEGSTDIGCDTDDDLLELGTR